jgi:hypothetical protein
MRRHLLPGEGENSEWFRRLNGFEQQETLRQVQFKRRHWPGLSDGEWSGRKGYTYPHILPAGYLTKAFYPPIADEALAYCCEKDIAVHSEALNLRSSQVCCFNVMFPLRQDLALAKLALAPLLPGVQDVEQVEFEYTGPPEATTWLGEPAGGKRGQNRTSVDVAIWWRSASRRILTLVEWKYTEPSFGTCGGYNSRGNRDKRQCLGLDVQASGAAQHCFLTRGRNNRRYWEHMGEAGINLQACVRAEGCPFRGPFYQLMRLFMLAAFLRLADKVDEVTVASVDFLGNASIHQVPTRLSYLGSTVEAAWNAALGGVPPLRHVNAEQIVGAMCAGGHLATYLNERYGL